MRKVHKIRHRNAVAIIRLKQAPLMAKHIYLNLRDAHLQDFPSSSCLPIKRSENAAKSMAEHHHPRKRGEEENGAGGEERGGIMRIEDGGNGKLHDILTEE